MRQLTAAGRAVLVVDWDPGATVEPETSNRARIVFGDADDAEFPGSMPLQHAQWIVSTIPQLEMSKVLVHGLGRWGFAGKVAVTTHHDDDAARLAPELASGDLDLVINPFDDASRAAAQRLVMNATGRDAPGR